MKIKYNKDSEILICKLVEKFFYKLNGKNDNVLAISYDNSNIRNYLKPTDKFYPTDGISWKVHLCTWKEGDSTLSIDLEYETKDHNISMHNAINYGDEIIFRKNLIIIKYDDTSYSCYRILTKSELVEELTKYLQSDNFIEDLHNNKL